MERLTQKFFGSSCLTMMVVLSIINCTYAQEPIELLADEIIERMAKTYATCLTYSDSGMVTTTFIRRTSRRVVKEPFTTAFVRPDRFRFEYREGPWKNNEDRYIICREGDTVRSWWYVTPGVLEKESLSLALAGATGVSSSSAHTIPALLMPKEISGRKLTSLSDAWRIKDDTLEEFDCYRIKGKYADSPMTIWIDKQSFLVRRIDSEVTFSDFRTEETTIYKPVIDEWITDDKLVFDPPEEDDD